MRIDQFLPTLAAGDAIGMHALNTMRALRDTGVESEIFADDIHAPVRDRARHYREYKPGQGRVLFHSSTASPMTDFVASLGDGLLIDYHNITPPAFFQRWEPVIAREMTAARAQLRQLLPVTRFALADSTYNEDDLRAEGFENTAVAPILVDFSDYDRAPDSRTLARLSRARDAGGAQWLFVGRISPNKCQHDVVAAFAVYRRLFDPKARLTLIGGATSVLYFKAIGGLARELGIGDAVQLADAISFPEVLAHYHAADVLVCLSEHEGFNVPVLEAMHFGVPVVAYASCAVPETVGDAGVVLEHKDPLLVATAVNRVLTDDALRQSLVAAGRARVDHFSLANTSRRMVDALTTMEVAHG